MDQKIIRYIFYIIYKKALSAQNEFTLSALFGQMFFIPHAPHCFGGLFKTHDIVTALSRLFLSQIGKLNFDKKLVEEEVERPKITKESSFTRALVDADLSHSLSLLKEKIHVCSFSVRDDELFRKDDKKMKMNDIKDYDELKYHEMKVCTMNSLDENSYINWRDAFRFM